MKTDALDSARNLSAPTTVQRSFTRFLPGIARYLLGIPLVIFGFNGFFNFIAPPPDLVMPEKALTFINALMISGYMTPLISLTLIIPGVMLMLNRFVPLALVLLAPFWVNSLCYHFFLERSGLPPAVVFTALTLSLAWVHREAYRPLFVSRRSEISDLKRET
jgi:hypothetical protein